MTKSFNSEGDLKETKIIDKLDDDFEVDWGVETIKAPSIWDMTKGKGVKVAIMDTGIDMNHPDFNNIKATINMHTQKKDVTDEYGHGTHVAGLIAGSKTGVAPEVDLYITKVLDENGHGSMTNVLDGITFAINHGVDVLCISLGMRNELPKILRDRIAKAHQKGVTVVCATGNSNRKYSEYPAFYDTVIAVGGVNNELERASFSNYGWNMDVVAPSVDILSTYKDGNYALMTGTSMASPLVAGAIALIKAYHRDRGQELSPNDIRELLSKLSDKKSHEYGYGLMDLEKILKD